MFVRADLSKSQQAVQSAHAVIEMTRNGFIHPDSEHPSLVLCSEPSEQSLMDLSDMLSRACIRHIVFREPDRSNEVTAIATEPLNKGQRKLLRKANLLEL